MLFMVIEHFRAGPTPVAKRFREFGRMLPEGVSYHASWIDSDGLQCFQVMEAQNRESVDLWVNRWNDLVDFTVIPVSRSAEFWDEFDKRCAGSMS